MALIRVAQYSSTPTVVTDYQAQNAHLQAFTNQLMTQQFILDSGTAQPVIKQGCYVSHGGSLYVADADTPITGSPGDGSVYIRVSGTTSLTVEFVNNISGYTWNPAYTALTSGSYTLLPYLIVKASTVWARYNFNPNNQSFGDTRLNSLAVAGAINGASINTGSGAMTFDQGVKTTDSPKLVGLDISTPVVVTAGSVLLKDVTTFTAKSTSYVTVYTYAPLRIGGILRVFHTLNGDTDLSRTYSLQVAVDGTAVYTGTYSSSSSIAAYTDVTLPAGSVLTVSLKSSNASYAATATLAIGISAKPSNLLQCLATYLEDI